MDANPDQPPNPDPAKVFVSPGAFAAKYQNKREVYRFFSTECGAYLPPFEDVTIFHLRDLAGGKKRIVKNTEVKHISVPLFEGLKIETMLEFAEPYDQVWHALPAVKRERDKLPR